MDRIESEKINRANRIYEDSIMGIRNIGYLTLEQKTARNNLILDWGKIPEYESYDGICDCLMLGFKSNVWNTVIWIGIELDGYAHS